MGICHGKLHAKSSCHPSNNSSHTHGAPSAAAAAAATSPLHHAATASPNPAQLDKSAGVAKNHVVPHPHPPQADASAPSSPTDSEAPSTQQSTQPSRKLERSFSITARKTPAPQFDRSAKSGVTSEELSKHHEHRDATQPTKLVMTRHASLKPQMHRSGSETRLFADDAVIKATRRKKKPISVSLEVILRDERARMGFFKFIQAAALQERIKEDHEEIEGDGNPSGKPLVRRNSIGKTARATSDYREDCVLFWLEINDLLKIPSGGTGSFQIGLMLDLFEVYIAKGAPRELPMVSAAERESLAQYIQDRNLERALLSFKMLLLDALEVVTTSFDEYVRAEGRLGYNHATRVGSMRNVLARLAKMNVGHHQADRRSHLHDIISTPAICRMFREFLKERNLVENLLFIIDALAFEDLVNTFEREPSLLMDQDGSHQDYCLRQAQKIFNKYVRYGSKAEICLGATVKEKLLQEIVEYPLGPEVFNEAVLLCSAELANSHLDMFYRSLPYLEYQAAIRKGPAQPQSRNSMQMHRPIEPTGAVSAAGGMSATTAVPVAPNIRLPSLSEILNGTGVNFFRDFLKEEGMENTLFFYKEVGEFQRLPHGQKHYIQNKARKIFEKFVRRGGKLEVELPVEIRRDILWKLAGPTESTFSDAQRYIFNVWEHKYLAKFRAHTLHQEMLTQLAAAPSSNARDSRRGSGSGSGGNTDSSTAGGQPSGGGDWVDVTKITLREFLDVEFLRRFFRLFLEKEQCANELFFYFEIAHFQQFPTSDYLTRQAKKLFYRFCDPSSREYITISESIRREIHDNLAHARPAMFNKAQEEILAFFAATLFPKFQQSDIYETIRITPQGLRSAKLSAIGAATRKELNGPRVGARASANGGAGNGSVSTEGGGGGGRTRGSVFSVVAAARELSEEAVSVSMILENPDTRALFLFFAEEMCVLASHGGGLGPWWWWLANRLIFSLCVCACAGTSSGRQLLHGEHLLLAGLQRVQGHPSPQLPQAARAEDLPQVHRGQRQAAGEPRERAHPRDQGAHRRPVAYALPAGAALHHQDA